MRKQVGRELWVAAQYFGFVLAALVVAFFMEIIPVGGHVNIKEAWRNVESYVQQVLLIFAALSLARVTVVCAVRYLHRPR